MEILVRFEAEDIHEMTDVGIGQAVRSILAEAEGVGLPAPTDADADLDPGVV
jgi:hypothetical protein